MSLRRRTILGMAVSAIGLAAAPGAQATPGLVDLQVVDRETGQTAPVWRHGGRLFVAGQPGARYSLRVTNNSAGRVLVVMSVDGVNILTGQTANYGQTGYVFGPYETADVSGWRKSDTEVAAFTFARLSQSYAARTGRPGDVGVIGIAAFTERVATPLAAAPVPQASRRAREDSGDGLSEMVVTGQRRPAAPAAAPPSVLADAAAPERRQERLGTGHGAREWSVVTSVPFERASRDPALVRQLEYDTYDNLVARGVIPRAPAPVRRPRPFPGAGYVPDPPEAY
jgi:hypothetical protein